MICSKCHTDNPNGSAFCIECGAPLQSRVNLDKENYNLTGAGNDFQNGPVGNPFEGNQPPYYNQPVNQVPYQPPYQQTLPNYPNLPRQDEPVTMGEWLGMWALNLIPIAGPIIFIVMLFIWAFGDTNKQSLKTYSRAMLIIYLISIVIMIVAFSVIFTVSDSATYSHYYY